MKMRLPVVSVLALVVAIIVCFFLIANAPLVPGTYDVTVYNGGRPVLHIENATWVGGFPPSSNTFQFDSGGKRYILSTDGLVAVREK